ncbi:MAG: hypothetical protein HQL77_08705, partial [Magnetococcales bacterium]|nr:hypothetical protein [Magnetococcales bacterium]
MRSLGKPTATSRVFLPLDRQSYALILIAGMLTLVPYFGNDPLGETVKNFLAHFTWRFPGDIHILLDGNRLVYTWSMIILWIGYRHGPRAGVVAGVIIALPRTVVYLLSVFTDMGAVIKPSAFWINQLYLGGGKGSYIRGNILHILQYPLYGLLIGALRLWIAENGPGSLYYDSNKKWTCCPLYVVFLVCMPLVMLNWEIELVGRIGYKSIIWLYLLPIISAYYYGVSPGLVLLVLPTTLFLFFPIALTDFVLSEKAHAHLIYDVTTFYDMTGSNVIFILFVMVLILGHLRIPEPIRAERILVQMVIPLTVVGLGGINLTILLGQGGENLLRSGYLVGLGFFSFSFFFILRWSLGNVSYQSRHDSFLTKMWWQLLMTVTAFCSSVFGKIGTYDFVTLGIFHPFMLIRLAEKIKYPISPGQYSLNLLKFFQL